MQTDLAKRVKQEVLRPFQDNPAPALTDVQVKQAVNLLFQVLNHEIGDADLDGVGGEIIAGLHRWIKKHDLVKLADRYEPFCKFLLSFLDPAKYAQLQQETSDRLSAAKVIKSLNLVSNKDFSLFECCRWQDFPPKEIVGKPGFIEHIARIYVYRNLDDHRARILSIHEKAQVAQSFCVFLVWTILKHEEQIRLKLTAARFSPYLNRIRDEFKTIGITYVELLSETRSAEEYRIVDPLLPVPDFPQDGQPLATSTLPDTNRITVIEAEPGAGKTTTLKYLAWKHADNMLSTHHNGAWHVPVYLKLPLLEHEKSTIKSAVLQQMGLSGNLSKEIPWNSILLLIDGLNEVSLRAQAGYKTEINDIITRFSDVRTVVASRPNFFGGEFAACIVVLRRLTDKQLITLFRHALKSENEAEKLLAVVLQNQFLSSWSRVPLHAAMIAGHVQQKGLDGFSNHSKAIRHFLRKFLDKEAKSPGQTFLTTKELLLSHLAFITKLSHISLFSRAVAINTLRTTTQNIGAITLDVPLFIQEVLANNLLQCSDEDKLQFTHELYHDYFTACELEAKEQHIPESGVEFVQSHFSDMHWFECIRLFAGLTGTSRTLIARGAELNPLLAWRLMKDANLREPELNQTVALAAYSVLEGSLYKEGIAAIAGACLPILASLERDDLVEQAIIRQQQVLVPVGLRKMPEDERREESERMQEAMVPLNYGLISVFRLANQEQQLSEEGCYCNAARAVIRACIKIKAARILAAILASWTGKTFEATSLVPSGVLEAIIDIGVDKVLTAEDSSLNDALAKWLTRASEAGFSKAWPAYGRIVTYPYKTPGLKRNPTEVLKWLRKAHEGGDKSGTLQLALLLIEYPSVNNIGEGERLLRELSQTHDLARFELGKLLMSSKRAEQDNAEGFDILLALAEKNHSDAHSEVFQLWCSWFVSDQTSFQLLLPNWAFPFELRLKALVPNISEAR